MAISSVGSSQADLLELRRLLAIMAVSVFAFCVLSPAASFVLLAFLATDLPVSLQPTIRMLAAG